MVKHKCRRCGECCIIHWKSFGATDEDVARWRSKERTDILRHVVANSRYMNDEPWVFDSSSCPFLKKDATQSIYYCAINDTKPFYCRNYPDDGTCEYMSDLNRISD